MNNIHISKKITIIKKKKKIFIFTWNQKNFFFLKKIKNQKKIWIDNTSKKILIRNLNKQYAAETILNIFFYTAWFLLFNKLKFNGKGYKIKKNQKKTIQFLFNFSHKTYLYLKKIIFKKIGKNKFILFSTKKKTIKNYTSRCIALRSNNIYTKRGLRTACCIIKKKNGKKTNN